MKSETLLSIIPGYLRHNIVKLFDKENKTNCSEKILKINSSVKLQMFDDCDKREREREREYVCKYYHMTHFILKWICEGRFKFDRKKFTKKTVHLGCNYTN